MEELKLYYDHKSPYAYLAAEPAFDLPSRFRVKVRWMPFQLRIKGKGERSQYSEWKARYSYMDARRWANRRGGFLIRGPVKVYETSPSLIGGLYAERQGLFRDYTMEVYARFFEHRLEIDEPAAIAELLTELGADGHDYLKWADGEGRERLEVSIAEAHQDHIFGVPIFCLRGELFWGHDRIPLLEERLVEFRLERALREPEGS